MANPCLRWRAVSEAPADAIDPSVRARVEARAGRAREHLGATVDRRQATYDRLKQSLDPDELAVARVYRDYLIQAQEIERTGAALVVAADRTGDLVVGRLAVFDDDRDVVLVSWFSPEGQRQLLSDDRLLVSERDDGAIALHTLKADDRDLAVRVRELMRASAAVERMSDPLATLTLEQTEVLTAVTEAPRHTVLHGPPGSGKSAIVMVELARRVLSADRPEQFRALFVTGTDRLAARAEGLGRMLGTASITAVTQERLLRYLDVSDHPTPQADAGAATGSLAAPMAVEREFRRLRGLLHEELDVPHPLGLTIAAAELATVRRLRAEDASASYRESSEKLAAGLAEEYARILPGERAERAASEAAELLRPRLTPTGLLARAGVERLPRALSTAATAGARLLLERKGDRHAPRYDLVVVDEYQRLPGIVAWLLTHQASALLLSGDPWQAFAEVDASGHLADATVVSLRTSLRVPESIARWLDRWWEDHGLAAPGVRAAAAGGTVHEHDRAGLDGAGDGGATTIAPASLAGRHEGWLDPTEAVGLEWSTVRLVEPERILEEHGPAGLFIAATRAIDELHVYA
jgi:hypothetical protein